MAYADQQMSGNKITALIIVAIIHVALGYALITGLAYKAVEKVVQKVTTIDIEEEVKKEEPPPRFTPKGPTPNNQRSWAGRIQENYPSRAIREQREGRVGVRVQVNAEGRVTSCTVTNSSGSSDLDTAACEGMERYARYNPATDGNGDKVAGTASTTIVYRLQ
jgi:periplasmic protein TonB